MKTHIDKLFSESEHEKSLDVRPELWHRLERRLDDDGPGRRRSRPWLVAASLFVIVTLSALLFLNIDRYHVEDLLQNEEPRFSKEHIANLEELYHVPPSIFLNPQFF